MPNCQTLVNATLIVAVDPDTDRSGKKHVFAVMSYGNISPNPCSGATKSDETDPVRLDITPIAPEPVAAGCALMMLSYQSPVTFALAVMVDPLRPKLTLPEFENVTEARFWLVVPALKFTTEMVVAPLAVMTDPLSPKLIPLTFENVTAERLLLVLPAEMLMFDSSVPPPGGRFTVALAVATPASASLPAVLLKPMLAVEPTLVLPISKSGPT